MSLFSVGCLLCYSASRLHFTSIAYEFQALQYTHYQHVNATLDVDKWTLGVGQEFKRTITLAKYIQNIIQREKS